MNGLQESHVALLVTGGPTYAYNPANYPNHGTGLFFVGLEANGTVYAYALNHATGGVTRVVDRPAGMANLNNEGFATAPLAECVANYRPSFWADDAQTSGHAVRRGTVTCSAF